MIPYDDDRQIEGQFPPFGQQFGPPFGQGLGQFGPGQFIPGFQPGVPGGFMPPGQAGQGFQPPSGPPPSFTPSVAQAQSLAAPGTGVGVFAVDPGAIIPCRFRFVYLWLRNGQQFWAFLVFVGRRSVAGWRWTGRRWVYFGVDLDEIQFFACY
ncbi:hypothetical protein CDQ84_08285 [Clostridium thermosuccinogenes]|jgi:hypothetical protein|uniref:Transporter n=1 Tax=Clostridium thermosuccinogenes TaxID=84032 RepID=A0A2K2F1N6_9CLOT|nr:hypothetical protein [Pseudoclostridium thermosuccinogenes]AUS96657.1 hypothetical protein CDO33_09525 [Pseudoclostridium thermosuccinogenes]PNT92683.1 hypothetical protein CDQ83_03725 [Pseudoclostridium thermosuccinogenes]PNT97573.1 hypothetical protein CDQ85_08130 [Pseudoclostridium thermosuccinogenes]PNT99569.1 hypothetical protein CDQ84_08285 [Pseudoclostridium thermosuccinogenes]